MSQSTFDDDELFGEAASEMRSDVEESLAATWEALPDADDVWETDAGNTLGVLNGLRSALSADDAAEHLAEAKKWFTMGQRAGAFEDADDLEAEILELEELIADIETAHEEVSGLAATVPELRSTLQEAAGDEGEE
ncbi:hypothetical protein BRD00_10990 [Halobacteriales archaeon QS_8_69_26]|nr:MAG: hypothetical protein BRD00_10990 [Halobacteriales archaeon QS_8_69_26]